MTRSVAEDTVLVGFFCMPKVLSAVARALGALLSVANQQAMAGFLDTVGSSCSPTKLQSTQSMSDAGDLNVGN